ncbi:replicative DNA helicase [Streptomyces sp. ISL-12]|uniref:DnaB-like helicase N-terminal domain-containing protein n=1 Tax=Streptomyces sp. ISL-12 TaxID=2819177 RepID=UPI001BE78B12|nr:DnaB-like helicase N-terminal domain-containing protein [Streptomyces sp. ISL-12]MBT2409333.1 replicative DNA helicase [Streptomyces sp. ISL-12]
MPHPFPLDDGDETLAPPAPAVFHAEQALLGALLLEPHHLADLTGITAGSFSTAVHSALFAAISTLPAPDPAEHAKNTNWLDQVLTSANQQVRGLTASYLHTVIQVCPWPRHAPAYARMVEAEHARRRLRTAAEHLVQTVHDVSLPNPVQAVLTEADALTAVVDDITARFPPRAGVLPSTPVPPPGPSPGFAEAIEEDQVLLATAAACPQDIESVGWLVPDDFTHPLHAGLWQCLSALARRHEPVDPVTILWEAQQRGLLDHGTEPSEVLHLLAKPAVSLGHWAEQTLRRSLLAKAEHTGRRIQAYADAPAITPFQLVIGARRALADLSAVRTRWQHATTPPQRPHPAPTTRAGPPTTTAARTTRTPR